MQNEIMEALEEPLELLKITLWDITAPYYDALIAALLILVLGGIIAIVSKSRMLFRLTKLVAGLAAITIVLRSFGIDFF